METTPEEHQMMKNTLESTKYIFALAVVLGGRMP